jgi:hypothetical protein
MTSKKAYIFLLLIFISSFYLGCSSSLNKIYEYKQASYSFEEGKIGAKLIGTYKSQKGMTTKGSPYELLFWYETKPTITGSITVTRLELRNANKKLIFISDQERKKELESASNGYNIAYFSIKDLALEYTQYELTIDLRIDVKNSITDKSAILKFDKDYKEYKSNKFWEKISSI